MKRKTVPKQNRKRRIDNISNNNNIGKLKKNRGFDRYLFNSTA